MPAERREPILLIASAEMLERFSYYGSVSLLVVFLSTDLGFNDTKTYSVSALFGAMCFALSVLGGLMADFLIGVQHLIVLGGLLMSLGHVFMAAGAADACFYGLALIAVGTGLFKGNITVLLGSCYDPKDPKRGSAFSIFYTGINVGALISSIACAYTYRNWGATWGFITAGVGITVGVVILLAFRGSLGKSGLEPHRQLKVPYGKCLALFITAVACISCRWLISCSEAAVKLITWSGLLFCIMYLTLTLQRKGKERNSLVILGILLIFCLIFYSLQSQIYFVISLFAQRNVDTNILGHQVPSTAFQAIPPMSAVIFGIIRGMRPKARDLREGFIELGIGLAGPMICFALLYLGCVNCQGEKISCLYLISTALIGISEILVGPFIYNQATLLAPKELKGYAMSFVLLAIAFGNLATVFISRPISLSCKLDPTAALSIYASGFGKVAIAQALALCLFCLTFYLMREKIEGVSKAM